MSSGVLGGLLALAERATLRPGARVEHPVVFVLGLPRSGTTLLSQYLVHRLALAYFTHGVGRHPQAPAVVTRMQQRLHGDYCSDFRSDYGKAQGPTSPREAGSFWGRFFGLDDYVRFEDISPADARTLRASIAATQRVFGGAPFVNKNVKHMLRIDALARLFPDPLFVVVRRDLRDVGLSILEARHKGLADATGWWSVKPHDHEALRELPLPEQIAGQIVSLRDRMHRDLAQVDASRVFWIDYTDFCESPESAIEPLRRRLEPIAYRNPAVASFAPQYRDPTDPDGRRLVEILEHHPLRS